MKRGINVAIFAVGVWLAPAWADDSLSLHTSPESTATSAPSSESGTGLTPAVSPATAAALKQEAYYHFFLEDYLTSATRLKLLEGGIRNDAETLNHVRLLRGSLYLAWGMHRPATVIFDRLVSAFPPGQDRSQVLLLIERLQYSRALYQAAIETYGRLTPDRTFASMDQAAYLAGMSHYALGNFEEAIRVMTTIPRASGYVPFAKLASAKSYAHLADLRDATRLLHEVGTMDAREDDLLKVLADKSRVTLGLLLTETGRYDEALPVLASVPSVSPFYPDAVFGTGWAQLYREQYLASLAAFQTLIHAAPNHPYALEALTTVARCYDRLGARGEALQAYGKALDAYRHEQQALDGMKSLIEDRARLSGLLQDFTAVLDGPVGVLLDDDGLRFWVRQYGELASLDHYLTRKLADMAVFEVMVDHRESVFHDRLPLIRQFLKQSPATPLRESERRLQANLDQAVQHETAQAWAFGNEATVLNELAQARRKSHGIGAAIEQLGGSPSVREQRHELQEQWKTADRLLDLLHGERRWTILTDVPRRRDDLQRAMNQIQTGLESADRNQRTLTESIGGMEGEIGRFRQRIHDIRRDLVAHQARLIDVRAQLIAPLQALLLRAVDRRSGQMEAMAAAARLSQVHILDVMSQ
ncbi:MAG: hypothetical protein HY207_09570 [Nitrospirae bacterium]|nr:hypothetical protein [Nitrospirota bacterium]